MRLGTLFIFLKRNFDRLCLILLRHTDTVTQVWDKLLTNEIHAIPLFDHGKMGFAAIVDVFDVLGFAIEKLQLMDKERVHSVVKGAAFVLVCLFALAALLTFFFFCVFCFFAPFFEPLLFFFVGLNIRKILRSFVPFSSVMPAIWSARAADTNS